MTAFFKYPAKPFKVFLPVNDGRACFDCLLVRREIELGRVACNATNFQSSLDAVDHKIKTMLKAAQMLKSAG